MNAVQLNRNQIAKLSEIIHHFKEVKQFTIESDSSSGIGPSVVVKFNLFDTNDTQIDITDVKDW